MNVQKSRIIWDFPGGSGGKESACSAEDPGLIPGSGRSPEGGNGNLLQYSCMENSMGSQRVRTEHTHHTHTHTHKVLQMICNSLNISIRMLFSNL